MKQSIILLALFFFLCVGLSSQTMAQRASEGTGVGIIVGEPTGLSFKSWTSAQNAVAGGLAWSFGGHDAIHIHGDYLWHNFNVFQDVERGLLPVYYGVGGRAVFGNDASIGVRIPIGINYIFEDSPIGIFLEVVPVVNLVPDTDFDGNGGLGVRIYF